VGQMGTKQKQTPRLQLSTLRKRFTTFYKSGYWGYKPHIPEQRGSITLLVVFLRQCYHGENVNVAVAAYVTTQARLKLYGYLSKSGKSVL
jgi:phosphatidylglycerophosphatase A